MKKYLIVFLVVFSFGVNAQIITNSPEIKEKKEKKVKPEKDKTKTGVEFFVGVSPALTYRTLTVNDGIFGQPLGQRVDEKPMWSVGYNLGVRTPLAKGFKLEIGAGYESNKEKYDFESSDSIYRYTNNYHSISIPIKLAYTYGDQIKFYGALGIVPKGFISMTKRETVLDINNKESLIKSRERDGYNLFLLDATASIGTQIKLSENYGVFANIEGRRQLTSNYNKQNSYVRKPFALGFNIGIEIYL